MSKDLDIFFQYTEDELKLIGVSRLTLWEEYISKHPNGVQYSRFCYYFTKWLKAKDCYIPVHHKAGDKPYVYHNAKKLKRFNLETGKVEYKEVFVATFGASQYTYVEACESQKVGDYLKVLENTLYFFCVVPDIILARSRTLKDKSLVEGAVKIVYNPLFLLFVPSSNIEDGTNALFFLLGTGIL